MATPAEKIGRLLVQRGLLTEEQLASCLREHTSNGTATLGQIIVSRGYIDADRLGRTLDAIGSLTFRCPEGCGRLEVERPRLDTSYPCRKCGSPLEVEEPQVSWVSTTELPPMPDLPAEVVEASRDPKRVLGKYVLVRELGRGGSASVVKAWDSILHQYVALKLIGTTGAGIGEDENSKEIQEFLREARTAVKLTHPNIVRVYEVGRQEGRYYLSMELIEGGSLAKLIHGRDAMRRPKFYADPQRYLSILRDAARALDHAHHHQPPIVHRDVKPHNILVDASGRACLADFGLAREMSGVGRLTATGVAKGTPCYMAPEQARGGAARLDGRTDVYGLGAILYELLTGDPPFVGPSTHEILQKVVNEEPVPPSQAVHARGGTAIVPPALERIALKALDKDPERRYPTAALFAADLDRYLKGRDVAASGASSLDRGVRWVARRKAVVIPAAIAVVMGIVALAAVLRSGPERVVERVVVQKEKVESPESRYGEIDAMAAGLRFGDALKKCEQLRVESQDPAIRSRLAQMAEDIRLEQSMLRGLVDRIRVQPRPYPRFSMDGMTINNAEVSDATMDRITIVGGGMRAGYPWSSVEPKQFVQLVRDYWPDLDGKPALGLAFWARRHRVDSTAKASAAESPEARYFKLLHEAERALADGDLSLARDRFDQALSVNRDGKEAREGLDRVTAAGRKPVEKPAEPAPEPPPVQVLENPRLAEEHQRKGNQFVDAGQYQDAVDEFTQAIAYSAKKGDPLASRGYARYHLGQWAEARADFVASAAAGSWNDDYPQLFIWLTSARLDRKADASAALRTYTLGGARSSKVDGPWFIAVSKHLTDDLSESDLLRISKDDTGVMKRTERECEAFFYIGTKHLLAGNTGAARQWFNKSIATGVTKFIEYKGSQAELDRLGSVPAPVVKSPLPPKPAAAKGPVWPPAPKLEANEKLILMAPEGIDWRVLSIAPDGSEAAYKETRNGKASIVWKLGRLDDLDRVEDSCVWKSGNKPVARVWRSGKVHISEGSTLYEPWTSVTEPLISPQRTSIAYVAKDGPKTYLVYHGRKAEVLSISEASMGYTPDNRLWYYATVPTTPTGDLTGCFLDQEYREDISRFDTDGSTPAVFSADGSRMAYSTGTNIRIDAITGPSFERVTSLRLSADGRTLAYVAHFSTGGKPKKAVVLGNTLGVKYDDIAGTPVLSRDGRTLAYVAKRGLKWVVVHGSRAGEEFDSIPARLYDVDQPVMSLDGRVVAYTAERGGLRSVIVNGKEVDTQPNPSAPSISPDGKFVSYGFVTGPYFIWKTVPVPGR